MTALFPTLTAPVLDTVVETTDGADLRLRADTGQARALSCALWTAMGSFGIETTATRLDGGDVVVVATSPREDHITLATADGGTASIDSVEALELLGSIQALLGGAR